MSSSPAEEERCSRGARTSYAPGQAEAWRWLLAAGMNARLAGAACFKSFGPVAIACSLLAFRV